MTYKYNYKNEALEFLIDPGQVDCKLGDLLEGLADEGGEHFVLAIKELSVTEIVDAALIDSTKWSQANDKLVEATLIKDITKWSQKIEEIKENQAIVSICPDAKVISNTYEEIKLSLLEITDSQIHELLKMFSEHSIKIVVESSSLLVKIIKDIESR